MSWQINFFAHSEDLLAIEKVLTQSIGQFSIIMKDRGKLNELSPVGHVRLRDLDQRKVYLVPEWPGNSPRPEPTTVKEDEYFIDTCSNRVIEFIVPKFDEITRTATAGRFYWSYRRAMKPELVRKVRKAFAAVRKQTVRFESKSVFRVCPLAIERAKWFVFLQNVPSESPTPSPFYRR